MQSPLLPCCICQSTGVPLALTPKYLHNPMARARAQAQFKEDYAAASCRIILFLLQSPLARVTVSDWRSETLPSGMLNAGRAFAPMRSVSWLPLALSAIAPSRAAGCGSTRRWVCCPASNVAKSPIANLLGSPWSTWGLLPRKPQTFSRGWLTVV